MLGFFKKKAKLEEKISEEPKPKIEYNFPEPRKMIKDEPFSSKLLVAITSAVSMYIQEEQKKEQILNLYPAQQKTALTKRIDLTVSPNLRYYQRTTPPNIGCHLLKRNY